MPDYYASLKKQIREQSFSRQHAAGLETRILRGIDLTTRGLGHAGLTAGGLSLIFSAYRPISENTLIGDCPSVRFPQPGDAIFVGPIGEFNRIVDGGGITAFGKDDHESCEKTDWTACKTIEWD